MAPAYRVVGGSDHSKPFRGTYVRVQSNCSGRAVYRLGGRGGMLFLPADNRTTNTSGLGAGHRAPGWMIGPEESGMSCLAEGYLAAAAHGRCAKMPDGRRAGRVEVCWRQVRGKTSGRIVGAPVLIPDALDPCCGIDCGQHGNCAAGRCRCNGSYTGERCAFAPACRHQGTSRQSPGLFPGVQALVLHNDSLCRNGYVAGGACAARPLPSGLAPGYMLQGGPEVFAPYRGVYRRSSELCGDVPVYRHVNGSGYLAPTETTRFIFTLDSWSCCTCRNLQ